MTNREKRKHRRIWRKEKQELRKCVRITGDDSTSISRL
jgi:hypothetical protein